MSFDKKIDESQLLDDIKFVKNDKGEPLYVNPIVTPLGLTNSTDKVQAWAKKNLPQLTEADIRKNPRTLRQVVSDKLGIGSTYDLGEATAGFVGDAFSGPGRKLASLGSLGEGADAMRKSEGYIGSEGSQSTLGKIGNELIRDPALPLTALTGGVARSALKAAPLLQGERGLIASNELIQGLRQAGNPVIGAAQGISNVGLQDILNDYGGERNLINKEDYAIGGIAGTAMPYLIDPAVELGRKTARLGELALRPPVPMAPVKELNLTSQQDLFRGKIEKLSGGEYDKSLPYDQLTPDYVAQSQTFVPGTASSPQDKIGKFSAIGNLTDKFFGAAGETINKGIRGVNKYGTDPINLLTYGPRQVATPVYGWPTKGVAEIAKLVIENAPYRVSTDAVAIGQVIQEKLKDREAERLTMTEKESLVKEVIKALMK